MSKKLSELDPITTLTDEALVYVVEPNNASGEKSKGISKANLASEIGSGETSASIKTKYESNENTNAFTDGEKTKLAGVEENATADQTGGEIVNAINTQLGSTDWQSGGGGGSEVNDLTSIVTWANVPDTNITESSVTQHESALSIAASQVTDFDAEVSNNTSVAANTAKVSYTDAAKVAGIEAGADVTDTTNVTAAGALMDSEVTNLNQVKNFDSSDYASASHTHTHIDISDYDTELSGKENTTSFTPTADYHPATKKYVDDAIVGGGGYTDEQAQDAVGAILVDSSEIDFTYNDATPSITSSIVSGSIDESKLSTSVNASLDLADSAIQSVDLSTVATTGSYNDLSDTPTIPTNNNELSNGAGYITGYTVTENDVTTHESALTVTASQVSDFDAEVSNNSDVTANTSKVGVTDEISNIVEDITPQLGGDLDFNAKGFKLSGQTVSGSNGDLVYLSSSNTWSQADASAESTSKGMCAIRISATEVLVKGIYTTTGLTSASEYYASETAGEITTTAPTTSASIVRVIGYALSATELFFDADKTWVENA